MITTAGGNSDAQSTIGGLSTAGGDFTTGRPGPSTGNPGASTTEGGDFTTGRPGASTSEGGDFTTGNPGASTTEGGDFTTDEAYTTGGASTTVRESTDWESTNAPDPTTLPPSQCID